LQVDAEKHRAVVDESGGYEGRRLAALLLPFSSHAGPICVYSGDFPLRFAKFWNLDAMWERAYSQARLDASVEVVLNLRGLLDAGLISKQDVQKWVNQQKLTSGYTLLHQVWIAPAA
jgi:hypothetical protein